jgi:hypothetical protein
MISIYKYAAHSIDLEGSISLGKRQKSIEFSVCYHPTIAIDNLSKTLLDDFARIIGFGSVGKGRLLESNAQMYRWRMTIEEIREVLSLIEPELIVKRDQARLVLEACRILKTKAEFGKQFRHTKVGTLYTPEEFDRLESIHQQMALLNAKSSRKTAPMTDAEKLLREFRKR